MPKSFFKRIKDGDSQLYSITVEPAPVARQSNGDQIQHLMCESCEQFIQKNYEDYGTRLFVDAESISENDEHIYITSFLYKKYYLFIMSIIWRASVSTLGTYRALRPLASADKVFRHCLLNNTLQLASNPEIRLDHFTKITVLRITDPTNEIPQDTLDKLMCNIGLELGESTDDGAHYYFTVDGYLVITSVFLPNSPTLKTWRPAGQIKNRMHLKIPKVPYQELKQIRDGIAAVANSRDAR